MIQPETQDQPAELKIRLGEAEGTLHAIRNAEVDAITVLTPAGERVYSLTGWRKHRDRVHLSVADGMQRAFGFCQPNFQFGELILCLRLDHRNHPPVQVQDRALPCLRPTDRPPGVATDPATT